MCICQPIDSLVRMTNVECICIVLHMHIYVCVCVCDSWICTCINTPNMQISIIVSFYPWNNMIIKENTNPIISIDWYIYTLQVSLPFLQKCWIHRSFSKGKHILKDITTSHWFDTSSQTSIIKLNHEIKQLNRRGK